MPKPLRDSYDIHFPTPLPAERYKMGLVVTVWNRPDYLSRFLHSLHACHLPDTLIVFMDDCSTSDKMRELLARYQHPQAPAIKCYKQWHRGFRVHDLLRFAWDILCDTYGCEYLTNLDSDVVMRPDWLQRLHKLHERESKKAGRIILSGFNKHFGVSLEEHEDHNVRRFVGGANMFFSADAYRSILRDEIQMYWDDFVVEAMYRAGHRCLTVKPSCIQHIGLTGLFSSLLRHDFASDYRLLSHLHPLRLLVGIKRTFLGTNPLWFLSRFERNVIDERR